MSHKMTIKEKLQPIIKMFFQVSKTRTVLLSSKINMNLCKRILGSSKRWQLELLVEAR